MTSLGLFELVVLGRRRWWWKLHWGLRRHFRGVDPEAQVRRLWGDDPGSFAYGETPAVTTLRVLEAAGLRAGDRVVDVGSGRGMVVLVAAAAGYPATGIEYFETFVDGARKLARELDLPAEFICGDFLKMQLPPGDLYMFPATAFQEPVRDYLHARLEELPAGTLVVTQDWLLPEGSLKTSGSLKLPVTWGTSVFSFYRKEPDTEEQNGPEPGHG